MLRSDRRWLAAFVNATFLVGCLAPVMAQEPAAKPAPEKFSGIVAGVNAPGANVVRFRLTIER